MNNNYKKTHNNMKETKKMERLKNLNILIQKLKWFINFNQNLWNKKTINEWNSLLL